MATRRYDFIVGVETSTAPTPGTPSADADVITFGYASDTYAQRASWYDKQTDNAGITAIAAADRSDGQIVFNKSNNAFYRFDSASALTDDGDTVLEPDAGTGRWLKVTSSGSGGSGNSLIQEFDNQVSTFKAGEAISNRDAVCAEIHNGSGSNEYKIFKCDADLFNRVSFIGFARAAVSVTANVKTYTISAAYVSGNVIPITINGRSYSTTYASSSDATLQALATAIATDQDVQSASVTVVGGNQTGTDDRVITITGKGGLQLNITGTTVTSGASQPTVTIGETTAAVQNAVDVHQFGPLSGFTSLTPGALYYLSGTAGAVTTTPSNARVLVGRAMSDTYMFVDPSGRFVEQWGADELFIRSNGSSGGTSTSGTDQTEHFNRSAWATGTAQGTATAYVANKGTFGYVGFHWLSDGLNTSDSVQSIFSKYNRTTWSSVTNKATNRSRATAHVFNGFLTISGGSTTNSSANVVTTYDKFNNSSWTTGNVWADSLWQRGGFTYSSLIHMAGGQNSGGSGVTTHATKNTSDTDGTDTAFPISERGTGSNTISSKAIVVGTSGGSGTGSYEWSGSWAAKTAAISQTGYQANIGFFSGGGITMTNGGQSADSSGTLNTTQYWDGSTWSSGTASSLSRGGASSTVS